jgi:Arc/MetJ-type ribon-helix-helix transcriptional regulator
MGTNLDIELKVRISPAMSQQIDALVASRPDGTNRSDIVREALSLHLAHQLHKSGQRDLKYASDGIKSRLWKK